MMKIGWSRRDVSTTEPVNMPGQFYARISKGIMDPITINVLVLENAGDMAAFVSGDFMYGDTLLDEIREKTGKKTDQIPVEKILFNVTHTHSAPCIYREDPHMKVPHEGVEVYSSVEYRSFLTDSISDAIVEAYEKREEGAIAYGYGYAVVGHSRRVTYFDDITTRPDYVMWHFPQDGHAKMYGNTNDDMFAGYEGGADHYVNLMYTFDKEENLTGAVINVPCPSQNSEAEYMLTASFWNEVRKSLRAKYGDIGILAQCAAAGDVAPRTLHYLEAEKRRYALKYGTDSLESRAANQRDIYNRHDISERICSAFDEVLSWAKKDLIYDAPIQHSVKTLELEKYMVSQEERDFSEEHVSRMKAMELANTGDALEDFRVNSDRGGAIYRLQRVLDRYEKQQEETTAKMELHVIKVGDVAFATNAYELYTDFQHRIQARSPFMQTFIVQLTGQPDGYPVGYLATERAAANRGYSAIMHSCPISARGGQTLVEETVKELKRLHEA